MNKTKIEYVDYSWNPIKGYCPNNCSYCYAHKMYDRFGWDKTIRLDEAEVDAPSKIKWPSDIFVGSMIDLYHPQIPQSYVEELIYHTANLQQHTFITLTKFPERMAQHPFIDNWWLGATIEHNGAGYRIIELAICAGCEQKIFVSFEPLLTDMRNIHFEMVDWIIIGGLTPKPVHKKEWIDDIVYRADTEGIPVFIKDNAHYPVMRRDFPI